MPIVICPAGRKMRQLLAKALGLGEAFAEASRKGELEELTDLEASALATLQSWGFASDAAMNALAVAREEPNSSETAESLAERLRVWLCLHLPEDEIPEAFAAGKGQFEVRTAREPAKESSKDTKAAKAKQAEEELFQWLHEALKRAMEDEASAEAFLASVQVLLEIEEPTEEEAQEAMAGALELLAAEEVPEAVLNELQSRWGAVRALQLEAQSGPDVELAEGGGDVQEAEADAAEQALGSHAFAEPTVQAVPERRSGRSWFGWRADPKILAEEAKEWQKGPQGQKMKKARETLPASKVQAELQKLLSGHQVVLVHGETGSGKTTQIGQFILDAAAGSPARIVVTQPRRFAAISVARRVAEERGEQLGQGAVGYMVRGDTKMRADRCQLLFCQSMFRKGVDPRPSCMPPGSSR
eukprot:s428_g2.t5